VEDDGACTEEREGYELDCQSDEYQNCGDGFQVFMLRKASRCALDPDGGKVAENKDSCNDSWVDDGEVVAVNSADDACEDHVD